ncbi:MAG: glycosyltransferase family 4 protein [Paracoccaceae bacterium]
MSVLVNAVNDNARPRGPDRYLLELLPRMRAADPNMRFTVVHGPWQTAFAEPTEIEGVTFRAVDAPRKPVPRLLWQASGFVRLANESDADAVFLPNLIWTPGLRPPSVMTVHDLLHFSHPDKFGRVKSALLRRVIRRALHRSDALIAVSEATRGVIGQVAPAALPRTHVILEGGPEPHPQLRTPRERMFLYVGQIERTKHVPLLARAFLRSAVLRDLGYRLVILGPEGNDSETLAPLIVNGAGRIERPGYVDDAALANYYATARGFVFPSEAEGFGLVVLEAMAHGTPVIAADATSLPEVVGNSGLLVPPGDGQALGAAMEQLAQDDALAARLEMAGRARLARFSWDDAGRGTVAALRALVDQ